MCLQRKHFIIIHLLQTNAHTHTHVMFWCPAEGTLSFDADDVGSPDPVPNLYDPQNHGAFGPRPARHQIAWVQWMDSISACWRCSCKETMEHGVIRCRTSSYFDGPTSRKRVLGTRLQRKWLLWGESKTMKTVVPWNYKSLPKKWSFPKDHLFNDLGTSREFTQNGIFQHFSEFPTARPHPALSVHPSPQVGCATPKPRHQNRGQLALWNRKDMEGYLVGGLNQPISKIWVNVGLSSPYWGWK